MDTTISDCLAASPIACVAGEGIVTAWSINLRCSGPISKGLCRNEKYG